MDEKYLTLEETSLILSIYQVGLIFLNSTTKNDKLASKKGCDLMPKLIFALIPHTKKEEDDKI